MISLSPRQRETFYSLADVLIPAWNQMPSASSADPKGRWLDRTLTTRPELYEELMAVLDAAIGLEASLTVDRLSDEDPSAFEVLALVARASYYMNPKVRKRLGYPGQKPTPPYPDESEYYLGDGILDPVLARGAIYRDA